MALAHKICEPCFRGDIQSEGYSWCSDCEEILCQKCDKAHRVGKLMQYHHLVELSELPNEPMPSTNLDHCDIHQEQVITLFCPFHDDVCCTSCLTEKHRTCENIKSLEEVAKNVQSSSLFDDVKQSIPNLLETLNTIRDIRQNNADDIISQEKDIKERISQGMTTLRSCLEMAETKLIAQTGKIKQDALEKLESCKLETQKITEVLLKHQRDIEFTFKHGSKNKSFLLLQKLKSDICLYEKQVKETEDTAKTFRLDLAMETDQIESSLSSFATLNVITEQYKMNPDSVKQKNAAQVAPSTAKFELKHFVTMSSKNVITGIEITKRNELLLCDWQNEKLLIYKEDGTLIEEKSVIGDPYGIAVVHGPEEAVVVTMPFRQCIAYLDSKNHIFTKAFSTNSKYYGIQVIKDLLVVGKLKKIDILSKDGAYIKTVPCENIVNIVRYIRMRTDNSIIFTDSKRVQCITLEGTHIFEYSDIRSPRGVDIDVYGNIYIADKENKNVQSISTDAKLSNIVLDESDSIGEPLALCFSKDNTRLFVGSIESKLLAVFTCKWI